MKRSISLLTFAGAAVGAAAPASAVMAALVELSLAGRAELLDGGLVAGV